MFPSGSGIPKPVVPPRPTGSKMNNVREIGIALSAHFTNDVRRSKSTGTHTRFGQPSSKSSGHPFVLPHSRMDPNPSPNSQQIAGSLEEENDYDYIGDGTEPATLPSRDELYQHYHRNSLKFRQNEIKSQNKDPEESSDRIQISSAAGPQQSLWADLPMVKSRGLLNSMNPEERQLQEALFEVITSEASYVKSLNVLVYHFMASPKLSESPDFSVISKQDRKVLFGDIMAIRECSQKSFLEMLFNVMESDVWLRDICNVFIKHAEMNEFKVYVKYCANHSVQEKLLNRLNIKNKQFSETIKQLCTNPICQNLNFPSFVLLPMQRVTRYRLLMDAIYHRVEPENEIFISAQKATDLANEIVDECNNEAKKVYRFEQLIELEAKLEYRKEDRKIALVSASRWLLKHGRMTIILYDRSGASGGRKMSRSQRTKQLYLFLFTDMLMITEPGKKSDTYTTLDYCIKNMVQVNAIHLPQISHDVNQAALADIPLQQRFVFSCVLINNMHNKQVELILNAESETDRSRWIEAFSPPRASDPTEQIYDSWDCPQVMVINNYIAQQEDELTLVEGDVINVLRKTQDVWSEGERLRDCCRGWFPITYTQEIVNDHVRARNYKERLRILQNLVG